MPRQVYAVLIKAFPLAVGVLLLATAGFDAGLVVAGAGLASAVTCLSVFLSMSARTQPDFPPENTSLYHTFFRSTTRATVPLSTTTTLPELVLASVRTITDALAISALTVVTSGYLDAVALVGADFTTSTGLDAVRVGVAAAACTLTFAPAFSGEKLTDGLSAFSASTVMPYFRAMLQSDSPATTV